MHADDEPVGTLLNRRDALAILGISGATLFSPSLLARARRKSPHFPSCVVRPESTEGPYFVDERLQRSDIRLDPATGAISAGTPLALTLALSRVDGQACTPLTGAHVDVWHCDGLGVYSDVVDPAADTRGQRYLRGYQISDSQGLVRFQTIYPGWYPVRAVHIHFKVRTDPGSQRGYTFTSQLYFDDALTDRVHAQTPYSNRTGKRRRNADDNIFQRGGDQLLLDARREGDGYTGLFPIGLHIA